MARESGKLPIKMITNNLFLNIIFVKGQKALKDAGVSYDQIEQAYCGYVYGETYISYISLKFN